MHYVSPADGCRSLIVLLTWCSVTGVINLNFIKPSCQKPNLMCDLDTKCINHVELCDGVNNCRDGSDEAVDLCAIQVACNDSLFTCRTGSLRECIEYTMRCDGKTDCSDGSDEEDCPGLDFTCEGFVCPPPSGQCLDMQQVCDGNIDCAQGEDEQGCEFQCAKGLFRCGESFECINETKLCDNIYDCSNSADEPETCGVNECHSKRKRCSHRCHKKLLGYYCSCFHGYELSADLHHCQDVNECLLKGSCSQLCHNTEGSHSCSCKQGYKLQETSHCKAIGHHPMSFLVVSGRNIIKISSDFSTSFDTLVTEHGGNVGAMSFHITLGYVYWVDTKSNVISRLNFASPHGVEVIVTGDVGTVSALAVDWVAYKLYWVNSETKTIHVSELDGHQHTVLVTKVHLNNPKCLVLDPRKGQRVIYYSDYRIGSGSLMRISMDGDPSTNKLIYYTNRNTNLQGVQIDFVMDRLYWFDVAHKTVESCDVVGGGHEVLYVSEQPTSLTVFESYIYLSTRKEQGQVLVLDRVTGEELTSMLTSKVKVQRLLALHEVVQPEVSRPEEDVHCSHLKLLSEKSGYKCTCPHPLVLLDDHRTCNSSEAVTCSPDFCLHGGVCHDEIDSVKIYPHCKCPLDFNGSRCENKIDLLFPIVREGRIVQYKCVDIYCYNGGTCVEFEFDLMKPMCRCMHGYYGNRCELYYGYMLKEDGDVKMEKTTQNGKELGSKTTVISNHVIQVVSGVSVVFIVLCISLIYLLARLLRNLPRYDIVVNPRYLAAPDDSNLDEVVVNVGTMSELGTQQQQQQQPQQQLQQQEQLESPSTSA